MQTILTDDEIDAIDEGMCGVREFHRAFAHRIEAAVQAKLHKQTPHGWRNFLCELIAACENGDISEDCEHPDWKSIYVTAKTMLAADPEVVIQDETDAEKQVNCAEEILDGYAAHLDLKETSFDCIGDYIIAVCEALKGKS